MTIGGTTKSSTRRGGLTINGDDVASWSTYHRSTLFIMQPWRSMALTDIFSADDDFTMCQRRTYRNPSINKSSMQERGYKENGTCTSFDFHHHPHQTLHDSHTYIHTPLLLSFLMPISPYVDTFHRHHLMMLVYLRFSKTKKNSVIDPVCGV